jgi:hypothetical protein
MMNENHIILPLEAPISNEERKMTYVLTEKILLPVSLIIAVLFDRLMFVPLFSERMTSFSGIFWLCFLTAFYALHWKRLRGNPALWFIAVCSAVLCVWQIIFTGSNMEYGALTYLVVPAVLMAHVQAAAMNCSFRNLGRVTTAWFGGWFVKPFSGIPAFAGVISSLFSRGNKSYIRSIGLGTVITLYDYPFDS